MLPFSESALADVGRAAAEDAWRGGMTVEGPDGVVVEIPLVAEPEVLSRADLSLLAVEGRGLPRPGGGAAGGAGANPPHPCHARLSRPRPPRLPPRRGARARDDAPAG